MRKLYFAVALIFFIFSACIKTVNNDSNCDPNNEPPTIKVISPQSIPTLKPGDLLEVKALFTDRDVVYVASWEALRAAGVCGNNPYSGQFEPKTSEYEMNFKFIIPKNFAGEQTIRLYGVDGPGNIATYDIKFTATN
ncbi:MAG TPA: hypothetical protein VGQ04_05420 [Chitinophagaceae bacterium]|jgi:hypothetical protein|nr:hypothetical protein [Chitinophagaceae bacterium]